LYKTFINYSNKALKENTIGNAINDIFLKKIKQQLIFKF
jgi:hypothetical protein